MYLDPEAYERPPPRLLGLHPPHWDLMWEDVLKELKEVKVLEGVEATRLEQADILDLGWSGASGWIRAEVMVAYGTAAGQECRVLFCRKSRTRFIRRWSKHGPSENDESHWSLYDIGRARPKAPEMPTMVFFGARR